jgi:hypothetical protein
MKKILMSLSIALGSLTLIPVSAYALPKSCDTVCKCSTSCATKCVNGFGWQVTTCGAMELQCGGCAAESPEECAATDVGDYSEEELVCRIPEY